MIFRRNIRLRGLFKNLYVRILKIESVARPEYQIMIQMKSTEAN